MLFSSFKIKNLQLNNRIVLPPMCMYSSDEAGKVNSLHEVHYGTRAQGGVGLIIAEATAVEARGRITDKDLGIWADDHIEGLKSLVDVVHSFGSAIALQLGHAGRKAQVSGAISSTNKKFSDHYMTPQMMDKKDIKVVIDAFGQAAKRAYLAGFDAVEIHGAHGYLINQFLSPLVNKRTDEYGCQDGYGGRFLQEIITAIRENFGKPIILRISAEDFEPAGLHPPEYVKILNTLQSNPNNSIDLVDVSSGGVTSVVPDIPFVQGYQVEFARLIKSKTQIPVLTGGLITGFEYANQVIIDEKADLVWLGRELLRDPYWPLKAAEYFEMKIEAPIQYKRAEPYL